jgi:hypothetical protein
VIAPSKSLPLMVKAHSHGLWGASYMVARYAIGQLSEQTVHFEDLEDLRTPKVCVEHMRPRDQLRQPVGGKEGPCTRLDGLDSEMGHKLYCSVPAQPTAPRVRLTAGKACYEKQHTLWVSSTYHSANPFAKQTRYGFCFSVSTAIAKPYPWCQCFTGLEARNASSTPLPSTQASSTASLRPLAGATFGYIPKLARIANTTPLAPYAKKTHIAPKLSHMLACVHTHQHVREPQPHACGRAISHARSGRDHSTRSLERGGQMGLLRFPGSYFDDHILWIVYKK